MKGKKTSQKIKSVNRLFLTVLVHFVLTSFLEIITWKVCICLVKILAQQ